MTNIDEQRRLNKEVYERKIFRFVAGALMVGLLTFGLSLMAYQNYSYKKRVDSPQGELLPA